MKGWIQVPDIISTKQKSNSERRVRNETKNRKISHFLRRSKVFAFKLRDLTEL